MHEIPIWFGTSQSLRVSSASSASPALPRPARAFSPSSSSAKPFSDSDQLIVTMRIADSAWLPLVRGVCHPRSLTPFSFSLL